MGGMVRGKAMMARNGRGNGHWRTVAMALAITLAAGQASAGALDKATPLPPSWADAGVRLAQTCGPAFNTCTKECKERYNSCVAVRQAEICRPAQERCLASCRRTAC
ncbi:MAG: hypothetical protein AAGD34_15355 [Pseudomonadota bacterium]